MPNKPRKKEIKEGWRESKSSEIAEALIYNQAIEDMTAYVVERLEGLKVEEVFNSGTGTRGALFNKKLESLIKELKE